MNYAELFAQAEQKYGLPSGYLLRVAQIESGLNPNAKNPNSTAAGLFQFVDQTAADYGLSDKMDPYASTDAAARLARDNAAILTKALGRPPTAAELYLAHQQGGGGAAELLTNPDKIVGGAEIDLNGGSSGQTAGEFANQWIAKFNGGSSSGGDQYVAVQEGDDGTAKWDETTYLGVNAAVGPDRYKQIEDEAAAAQPYESWWGEVGASLRSSSWTAHMLRWAGEGVIDPEYTPSQTFDEESIKRFPEFYHDFLLDASSADNAASRIKWVEEDMVRRARLGAGGGSAILAEVASGIVDPVPLIGGLLTGGLGVVAKGGMAARAGVGAVVGGVTNAGLDAVSQEVFDDPYADPRIAGLIGAALGAVGGALSRNPSAAADADAVFTSANRTARGVLMREAAPDAMSAATGGNIGLRNMGAAENPDVISPLISREGSYLVEMQDEDVARGFGGKLDFGVSGQMISDENPFVRASGLALFEPAAGTVGHRVTQDSVNTVQRALDRQAFGTFMTEFHPARMAYLKEQGIFRMNLAQRARASHEFSIKVGQYVEDPTAFPGASQHIVRAAKAFSDGMVEWNRRMREAGLADLPENRNYVPKVAASEAVTDIDMRFREEDIHRWIGEAILAMTPDLDAKIVERIAKGYWRNLRRASYGMGDDFDRTIQEGNFDGFKRAMLENLEEADDLDEAGLRAAFDAFTNALDANTKPTKGQASRWMGHLKKRTLLDYAKTFTIADRGGKVHQMAVRDLFENDSEMLYRRYTRTMSGRVAFANMKLMNPSKLEVILDGVRSEADLQKWKDMIIESYRQTGKPHGEWEAKARNAIENLEFGWKRINAIPVWEGNPAYARWARRIKSMQFTRLMSNMGLNQVQEAWKIMSLIGFRAALSQLPSIRAMVKAARTGEISGDQLLEELTDVTGLGLDGLHYRLGLRMDDDRLGNPSVGRGGRMLDNALDSASHFTSTISGMRAIHDFQQRWAMKAVTQRLVDMARATRGEAGEFDLSRLGKHEVNRLASLGLGKEDAALLFRNLLDHSEFDGKKIVGVNVPKWDPEAVTKFRHFVGRYTDRVVQQNDYGALAKWMSNPVLGMFTQFRSFVYGAWAKSTLWSLNHMGLTDPRMMVLLLGELAAGTATYMLRNLGTATTEEGWQKFMEQVNDPVHLIENGWARTATSSVIPMFIDAILLTAQKTGFDVEPQFGNARSSGSAMDAFFGSPLADQAASLQAGLRGVKQAAVDGEEMSQSEIKSLVRAVPLPANFVPFSAALGLLIKDRPVK